MLYARQVTDAPNHPMSQGQIPSFFFLKWLKCFIFERKRAGEGAEREGDTERKAGSRLRAVSSEPRAGLEPTDREMVT